MTNQYFGKEEHKQDCLLTLVTMILESIVRPDTNVKTAFDFKGSVKLSLDLYLKRIFKFMSCSPECLVICMILLDRLQDENPEFVITNRNIHKLVMTGIMVSAKSHEDKAYNNSYYAKISGFSLAQLNNLERIFLELISYKSYITPKIYHDYESKIRGYFKAQQGYQQIKQPKQVADNPEISDTSQKILNY